ncbi:hypothetical protein SAMN05443633_11340 [Chryseobacterium arachidis]|uniref:CarboxypepD_reg-like domain-containing protein n=1 Tax=Chryseobacterium arachidis TaxID=1416778 RepID=A0A1M5IQR4_9FLAO|nr:hypothetical protein [Chryseobacterium arachidis]SHG30674.1 hypothetical protein SAMN05443633_11340 [Chryseobacterium arachidis]
MKNYLRIEKPCEESLENMHDVPGGKFCDLCSKKVIDFSKLNDVEISKILEENTSKKICGIFHKNQLNRPLHKEKTLSYPPRKITFSKVAAGLALTASIINSYPAQTNNSVTKELVNSPISKRQADKKQDKVDEGKFMISGRIISGDKQQPLVASVSLVTALKAYSTISDKDGYYSLEVPKEIVKQENLLEFSPGQYMYDKKLVIYTIKDLEKKQLIKLNYNSLDTLMGEVSVGPPGAGEKSLVIVDGKKLDYKLFNKSRWLYYNKYQIYYIPKEFVKFFTTNDTIQDLFIVFVKPK